MSYDAEWNEDEIDMEWNLYHDMDKRSYADVETIRIQKAALEVIEKTCPLLSADKDAMYGPEQGNLFAQSTTRRMEIARDALKSVENYLEKVKAFVGLL